MTYSKLTLDIINIEFIVFEIRQIILPYYILNEKKNKFIICTKIKYLMTYSKKQIFAYFFIIFKNIEEFSCILYNIGNIFLNRRIYGTIY